MLALLGHGAMSDLESVVRTIADIASIRLLWPLLADCVEKLGVEAERDR
jgi:hypothetical protein